MENFKEITMSRKLNASPEQAWKAWTDPEEIAQWWGPEGVTIPVCEIDLKVGGKLHIVMLAGKELGPMAGQRWPMQGTFKEIKTAQKLVFTNQAIDETGTILIEGLTTVVFEKDGSGTKITVTTSAKGLAPQAPQMIAGMEMGWNQQLDKLVEKIG
jgi:uncharacterized protein YndB with AHSA1/START domain